MSRHCFFSTQREISVIECFLFQVIYVNENGKHWHKYFKGKQVFKRLVSDPCNTKGASCTGLQSAVGLHGGHRMHPVGFTLTESVIMLKCQIARYFLRLLRNWKSLLWNYSDSLETSVVDMTQWGTQTVADRIKTASAFIPSRFND